MRAAEEIYKKEPCLKSHANQCRVERWLLKAAGGRRWNVLSIDRSLQIHVDTARPGGTNQQGPP